MSNASFEAKICFASSSSLLLLNAHLIVSRPKIYKIDRTCILSQEGHFKGHLLKKCCNCFEAKLKMSDFPK